ncbi:MAG: hypothetical protein ACK4YD_04730 [Chitinophagia bacterium]|jgi:hypothetical protein
MLLNIFEKLQLAEEKNLLIQGIPSTLEKHFTKLSFAKNVTPLLKSRKIDFALVFAINYNQLSTILCDVIPALREKSKLWIAYPKPTSKIVSDLNRDCQWDCLKTKGYCIIEEVVIDHVWTAMRFCTAQESSFEELNLEELSSDATVKDIVSRSKRKEKMLMP